MSFSSNIELIDRTSSQSANGPLQPSETLSVLQLLNSSRAAAAQANKQFFSFYQKSHHRVTTANPYGMQQETLEFRAKHQSNGRYLTQLYVCITVTLGTINLGYVQGTSAPFLRYRFEMTKDANDSYSKRYASVVPLGFLIGTVIRMVATGKRGPRNVMVYIVPINFLTWLLLSISENETWKICMVGILAIVALINSKCGKVLLEDAVHPGNLYHFQVISFAGTGFGIMLGYIFGYSDELFYYWTGIPVLLLAIQFVLLFFCPESPLFLYRKHNTTLAEQALIFFRGQDVVKDLRTIAKECETRNLSVSAKYMLLHKAVYNAIIILAALTTFKILTGYAAFLLVDVSIFQSSVVFLHLDSISKSLDGLILGVCHFLVPVTFYVILRFIHDLRKSLCASAIMVTISLAAKGVWLMMIEANLPMFDNITWPQIATRIMLIFSYHLGYGICMEILINEYIPDEVQHYVTSILKIWQYALLFIMVNVIISMGAGEGAFFLLCLAAVSFGGFFFCKYFIINGTGKTFKQIQMELGGNPIGNKSYSKRRQARPLATPKVVIETPSHVQSTSSLANRPQ